MTLTLSHRYDPLGTCFDVFNVRDPEVLIVGPAGTGKSRACLEKLHYMAVANPGMRGLMLRKTQMSLTSSGLVTWKRDVIPESQAAGLVYFYGGSAVEPAQYRYANGSSVVIGGIDRASKIMSSEYDIIYIQEATELTEDDWESLSTRLRSNIVSFQQILADCNPAQDNHWLKQRCDKGQTTMLYSRHEDNPTLYQDGVLTEQGAAYMGKLDALTGVRYRRLRKGEWASAEGVIFEEWDSAVHLVDRYDIPDSWTRYWVIDFGFTNPFVCQWWAEDPDGRLVMYREIYHTQRLVEDHAADILTQVTQNGVWTEPKPYAIICDHDAEGRATLRRKLGLPTQPANKTVTEGIQVTQSRLKPVADGKPRLTIMRDSVVEIDQALRDASKPTSTADEIPGYVWDMRPDRPPKELPVKEDDHGCDAMRYMVAHLDLRGKTSIHSPVGRTMNLGGH